jgi:ABC-type uncharacterized transport system fused permease/ATPase subunit
MCTYIYRAISGLWELGAGSITWNIDISNFVGGDNNAKHEVPDGVFFLPQKPYNLLGSLRQQIAYPGMCIHECVYIFIYK